MMQELERCPDELVQKNKIEITFLVDKDHYSIEVIKPRIAFYLTPSYEAFVMDVENNSEVLFQLLMDPKEEIFRT